MEKTYKRVPFDIELAKKIQSGEIEGRIKYSENDGCVYDADIIKFDLIADKSKVNPNSTLFRTIVAIVDFDNYQGVRTFNTDGYGCNYNGDDTKLFIEVLDNEPQFKPFDKVLVRDSIEGFWRPKFFSETLPEEEYLDCGYTHKIKSYRTINNEIFHYCIPYEGNEHLVSTTNKPKEN